VIVEEEVRKYQAALHSATLGPVIQKLHAQVDEIFDEEREKLEAFCPPELIGKIKATHHRIKQRLMHEVIQEIKLRLMRQGPGEGHGH
jgi:glutamyl-tRNA reductase